MARTGDRLRPALIGIAFVYIGFAVADGRPTAPRRRVWRRSIVRGSRGGRGHWLGVAPRDRPGRPWSQGLLAAPDALRREYPMVATVLRCRRFCRRSHHRRRNRSRPQPPGLAAVLNTEEQSWSRRNEHSTGVTQGLTEAGVSSESSPSGTLDVLVIGGGQAGLAMGYELAKRGMGFRILEAGAEIGHTWRSRWDSLKLISHTSAVRQPPWVGLPRRAGHLSRQGRRFGLPADVCHDVRPADPTRH